MYIDYFITLLTFWLSIAHMIHSAEYRALFKMMDNTAKDLTIGNILDSSTPKFAIAEYQIIARKSSYIKFNRYFRISDDGRIYTVLFFDRDNVNDVCGPLNCCQSPTCTIKLEVIVTHKLSRRQYPVEVTIEIDDENDNQPKFLDHYFTITIRENEKVFTSHRLPIAVDDDSPKFGINSYYLEGRYNQYFTITTTTEPILSANKIFDYENPQERNFELKLVAEDKGGKSAKLKLMITIEDENDNKPLFIDKEVNLTLKENTTYSTPIHIFEARDLDSGKNGKIGYYFSSTTLWKVKKIFNLNPDNGELYLTKKLDYELFLERQFAMSIEASDHGSPSYSDFCSLSIKVEDINDNSPIVEVIYEKKIPENEVVSDEVMKFVVRDEDSLDNAVSCEKQANNYGLEVRKMVSQTYFVFANKKYDYEDRKNITLNIVCSDSDKINPKTTNQTLLIHIEDKNDNHPQFIKKLHIVEVEENKKPNSTLIKVEAVDKDSGLFGDIEYFPSRVWNNKFMIDTVTGEIKLIGKLDREKKDEHKLLVYGKDGGGLDGNCTVIIRVLDINDNAPKLGSSATMRIMENSPVGTLIGQIVIKDYDLGENGRTSWSIDFIGNSSNYLELKNLTLYSKSELDREKESVLYLRVSMNDYGSPMLASNAMITVIIDDQNDNIPTIIYPRTGILIEELDRVILAENTPKFTVVLTVMSNDPDEGINGEVLYHLLPSNGSKYFVINQTTGEIATNWNYDSLSFRPTFPKKDIYKVSFAAYNKVKSFSNKSASVSSHFFLRVRAYHHISDNEVFYKRHKRPFFNNVVLLILIGGFTISLSAALIAAIVWAKSKFSSESTALDQVQESDGKFVMMMMAPPPNSTLPGGPNDSCYGDNLGIYNQVNSHQSNSNAYLYDPYVSLIGDHDNQQNYHSNLSSNYPTLTHSHSTTFNIRSPRDQYFGYDIKTMPRSILPTEMMHHYSPSPTLDPNIQQQAQQDSISSTNLAIASNINRQHQQQQKSFNSFYRTFEDDPQCATSPTGHHYNGRERPPVINHEHQQQHSAIRQLQQYQQQQLQQQQIRSATSSQAGPTVMSSHSIQRNGSERPYATISNRVASICDPTPSGSDNYHSPTNTIDIISPSSTRDDSSSIVVIGAASAANSGGHWIPQSRKYELSEDDTPHSPGGTYAIC